MPFLNDQTNRERDAELVRQIAVGDRVAFAEFYDQYAPLLFSIAARIMGNTDDAEDVLQESFLQIWEKAGSFDPSLGKLSVWAISLVRNKAIDRIRSSQRRARLWQQATAEFLIVAEVDNTANEAIHGHDKTRLIQSAIIELPVEQRCAIELAFFSGLSQNEISEKLQAPLGTVKARIRRGLLKLHDQLKGVL
ncbi:MAG TPA: sigma-70 family RNA polymerase sigma factor [Verrucomicrobiae bacterium]|jgi:RNA polymerase sigma-70 factor (ECF subfamily)